MQCISNNKSRLEHFSHCISVAYSRTVESVSVKLKNSAFKKKMTNVYLALYRYGNHIALFCSFIQCIIHTSTLSYA